MGALHSDQRTIYSPALLALHHAPDSCAKLSPSAQSAEGTATKRALPMLDVHKRLCTPAEYHPRKRVAVSWLTRAGMSQHYYYYYYYMLLTTSPSLLP